VTRGATVEQPRRQPASSALTQVRETAQALAAEGRTEEAFDYFAAALAAVLRKNTELELLLAKLRRERLGMRSERISPEQLALLLESMQLLTPEQAVDPEAEAREDAELDERIEQANQAARADDRSERPRTRGWHVRQAERRVHHVPLAPEEHTCGRCGGEKRHLGEDITRQLEYVPARFIEHEFHLEKYACPVCKDAVSTAPAPPKVIERSVAGASVLAHIVVSKYVDHTPLHRLHRSYDRNGVAIPVSTLADWIAGTADRVRPLVEVLKQRVLSAYVVRTDATGLKVLDPKSPDNIERGTIWCYVGDEKDVVFDYTPTGAGESGPWSYLAGRSGYIQADAASVFDRLYTGQAASAIEVGCWAHARRNSSPSRRPTVGSHIRCSSFGASTASSIWRTRRISRHRSARRCALNVPLRCWRS
jgi:transposase